MNKIAVLDNRVLQILSQSSPKAAIDLLGMRIATQFNSKYTEIMITLAKSQKAIKRIHGSIFIK